MAPAMCDQKAAAMVRAAEIEQAEAAPGPPLIAKVTGRLAGSAPSRRRATVAISAMGARLSALLKRIAEAIALKRSLRPEARSYGKLSRGGQRF